MAVTEYIKKKSNCQEKSLVNGSYLKTGRFIQIFQGSLQFIDLKARSGAGNPHPSKRQSIKEFSRSSRIRLLRIFSKILLSQVSMPLFITLTYHYNFKKNPNLCKQHLNTFLQYLRDNYPSMSYIWRLELQKRGAPHFHFLLFSLPGSDILFSDSFQKDLSKAWHRIADPNSNAHVRYGFIAKEITSYRMCFGYVSKYCAKENTEKLFPGLGRRWGYSTNLPLNPIISMEVPEEIYNQVKRIARKIYKKRTNCKKRFYRILRSRCSITFFCHSKLSHKILDWSIEEYLKSSLPIITKDMFLTSLFMES